MFGLAKLSASDGEWLGLFGMRQRLEVLRGRLVAGKGDIVTARIPFG